MLYTDEDLAAWERVTLPDFPEDDTLTNKMYFGLFGFDLEDFWTDCLLASDSSKSATVCPYSTLHADYDGWAIGSYAFMALDITLTGLTQGICDAYTNYCFGFYVSDLVANADYYFTPLSFDATSLSTSSPDMSSVDSAVITGWTMDLTTANYGFSETHFYSIGEDWADLNAGVLFYRF